MGPAIRAVLPLLIAMSILSAGNGLQITLLAVRANLEGFPILVIGGMLSAYYAGFIIGCRYCPLLVKQAGHIRSFAALASIASASALAHALAVDPISWLLLRAVTGFCFAGLLMINESWLNERACNATRGRVLSVYRIVDFTGTTIGQLLLMAGDPSSFALFAVLSILFSISLVPVALSTAIAPAPIKSARLDLRKLIRVSPLAAFGVLGVGAANGAFWALGPSYIQALGYSSFAVASFMTAIILGGALAQWPLGALSDRIDRRTVLVGTFLAAAIAGVGLLGLVEAALSAILAGAVLFGACAVPLFGLCVAHANDFAEPEQYVEINGGLLLLFGVGAIAGPVLAGLGMELYGPATLFLFTSLVYAAFASFGVYRMTRRPSPPAAKQETFVAVPRTSPAVFHLDPRCPNED